MNRSYSKKRHIQEANNRLEKRFLNEDTVKGIKKVGAGMFDTIMKGAKERAKLTSLPQQDKAWFPKANGTEQTDNTSTTIEKVWGFYESFTNPGTLVFNVGVNNDQDELVYNGKLSLDCNRTLADFKWIEGLTHKNPVKGDENFNYAENSSTPWHTNKDLYDFIKDKGWCKGAGVKIAKKVASDVTKLKNKFTGGSASKWDSTCDGESKPFKKMCKGETIKKVQGCLGIKADGLFGSGTETAINNKISKKFFTNADIDKLCGTGGQTPPKPTDSTQKPEEVPFTDFS